MNKKMFYTVLLFLTIALMVGMETGGARAENINPDNDDSQYAYGENVGWLNFEPNGNGGNGAQVSDSQVTGLVWAENIGWINLSPASYGGVVNDGNGNLSGYAWGENVGWINFGPVTGGVTIDANGDFDGWAWGENIGWINFELVSEPDYRVKTLWPNTLPPGCTDGDDDGYAAEGGECGPADCDDNDPDIVAPGVCGCFVSDIDTDGDGTPDCIDGCPADPGKVSPGTCGCGIADLDSDGDAIVDCNDGCPDDPSKQAPGACGCGVADTDTDSDGAEDCIDQCPTEALKTAPGACGCGVADTDSDGDAVPDCNDGCPDDPDKADPGGCGCGIAETDGDYDGVPGCNDNCPDAYNPGQEDANGNGIGDACDIYFEGFFEPIDNGAVNVAKAGQAIPVKWRLTDVSGLPISDAGSFVGLYSYRVSCMDFYGDPLDAIEEYAAGSSGLQYLGDGYWQYNWKTIKTYAGQCRDMYIRFAGGTASPVAQFKFK